MFTVMSFAVVAGDTSLPVCHFNSSSNNLCASALIRSSSKPPPVIGSGVGFSGTVVCSSVTVGTAGSVVGTVGSFFTGSSCPSCTGFTSVPDVFPSFTATFTSSTNGLRIFTISADVFFDAFGPPLSTSDFLLAASEASLSEAD